jgi:Fis family transcriptional regulator
MKTALTGIAPARDEPTGATGFEARPADPAAGEPARPRAPAVQLAVMQSGRSDPLSKCVEDALNVYLRTTDGHDVNDLHRFVIGEVERPLFKTVLRHVDGNRSRAAKILGLTRATLRKRLKDYGLDD